jgi:hypothetical protein
MSANKIVEDHPGLERDKNNTAIINTNNNAYNARLIQINATENKRKLDEQQNRDINNLKSDVAEIKEMLQKLTGGK